MWILLAVSIALVICAALFALALWQMAASARRTTGVACYGLPGSGRAAMKARGPGERASLSADAFRPGVPLGRTPVISGRLRMS